MSVLWRDAGCVRAWIGLLSMGWVGSRRGWLVLALEYWFSMPIDYMAERCDRRRIGVIE